MTFQPLSVLHAALATLSAAFLGLWLHTWRALRRAGAAASDPARDLRPPDTRALGIGFLTNFFDTLGIGAFATTTALLRLGRLVPDHLIPGTLNVGLTPPAILQAFIFTTILPVDPRTLLLMVASSTLGAWLGAGVVSRWPKRRVQAGMGHALLGACAIMLLTLMGLVPSGGEALGLAGGALVLAVAGNLLLGALMTLGIGLYAPCMILLSFLGMTPRAIFPIMMTSCACLMPVGGLRFLRERTCAQRVSVGLSLGGIPAVLVAAFLVREMPLTALRWVVVAVTAYTGLSLVLASRRAAEIPLEPAEA